MPHDQLVEFTGETTNWLNTTSWQENGLYSSANPSAKLLEHLRPFALEPEHVPTTEPPSSSTDTNRLSTQPQSRPARPPNTGGDNPGPWRHPNVSAAVRALNAARYSCSPPPTHLRGVDLVLRGDSGTPAVYVRCPGRLDIRRERIGKIEPQVMVLHYPRYHRSGMGHCTGRRHHG